MIKKITNVRYLEILFFFDIYSEYDKVCAIHFEFFMLPEIIYFHYVEFVMFLFLDIYSVYDKVCAIYFEMLNILKFFIM